MSETQSTNVRAAHGRYSGGKNQSESTLHVHVCWIPWVWTLICTWKLTGEGGGGGEEAANSKRWGLLFTCLNSRAIHLEVLEAMDASVFNCALQRFFVICGQALRLRCDRGTNFVRGKSELEEGFAEMDNQAVQRYLVEQGCEWVFNPPHVPHFGGLW